MPTDSFNEHSVVCDKPHLNTIVRHRVILVHARRRPSLSPTPAIASCELRPS